jgi:hypothetical protein
MRKYLHEPASTFYEEPQLQEQHEQSGTEESIADSTETETPKLEAEEESIVASPESLLGFSGTMSATVPAAAPLRRGFFRQLLSRFSSEQE